MNNFHFNPDKIVEMVLAYLPKLALAIVTLVAGLYVIKLLVKGIGRIMQSKEVDESLRPFIKSVISITLRILLLVSVMGMIGIEMTSFIAVLGAAGLSIGMALSGALQHFAGGVLLLIYKPFKKGDFIEVLGLRGTVKEIRIFNTVLNTVDNKLIFIPNGPLSTGNITNFTAEDKRRIDMVIGIGYNDEIDKARNILNEIAKADKRILAEPAPLVAVSELAASSVNFAVRVWVKVSDFQDVNFDYLESVKKQFDANNITFPYPKMDVNLLKEN